MSRTKTPDKPTAPAAPAAGPVTCTACNLPTHLAPSFASGRMLAVDDPADLNTPHRCVLARPAAVLTVHGGEATVTPLRPDSRIVGYILRGRLSGPAVQVPYITRLLSGRGVVILRRETGP